MTIFKPEVLYDWEGFYKKAQQKILNPLCVGSFSQKDADAKGLYLVSEKKGHLLIGNRLRIYWLLAGETGIVIDARFEAFGHPGLLLLSEIACEMMIGRSYSDSYNVSFDSLESDLKNRFNLSLPSSCLHLFGIIIDVLDGLAESCAEIPGIPKHIPSSGVTEDSENNPEPVSKEEWRGLEDKQKLNLIEIALEAHILPYIRMDGGDLVLLRIIDDTLTIAYQGACTGCYSAVGSTLNSIIEILKNYVYADIEVKVEEDSLSF